MSGGIQVAARRVPPASWRWPTYFVPNMARMQNLRGRNAIGRDAASLPSLLDSFAQISNRSPKEHHAQLTSAMCEVLKDRATISPLPSGWRGLAQLALETVANAVSCWSLIIEGKPLGEHSGKAYLNTGKRGMGERGKGLKMHLGNGGLPVVMRPTLRINLSCGIAISAPKWFLETRTLSLPLNEETRRQCRHAASLAVSEYAALAVAHGYKNGDAVFAPLPVVQGALSKIVLGGYKEEDCGRTPPSEAVDEIVKTVMRAEFNRLPPLKPSLAPLVGFAL